MDGYTCIKALTLGGTNYAAGSSIPAGAVLPGRVRALIKQGYISPAAGDLSPDAFVEPHEGVITFPIPVKKENGDCTVDADQETIAMVATIIQNAVEEAKATTKTLENGNALILIHALDNRKAVKNAAEDRAKELEKAKVQPPESSEEGQDDA